MKRALFVLVMVFVVVVGGGLFVSSVGAEAEENLVVDQNGKVYSVEV